MWGVCRGCGLSGGVAGAAPGSPVLAACAWPWRASAGEVIVTQLPTSASIFTSPHTMSSQEEVEVKAGHPPAREYCRERSTQALIRAEGVKYAGVVPGLVVMGHTSGAGVARLLWPSWRGGGPI